MRKRMNIYYSIQVTVYFKVGKGNFSKNNNILILVGTPDPSLSDYHGCLETTLQLPHPWFECMIR